eukprot:CAMPEP_0172570926 /NCGR_PEP_ID=MMETSP1067-20121228/129464_1 /TAXON_ID=265564 ORGANISM="Thalassiosira punctigera, Strain Tpunct2005C2" /NCGR_SAMPLE_ID=MMETSP1067 /ASSEMBLY_ACC=CAM_ASM_000444 /LENGTH=101 /DNA_ID=CAMNT_0013363133 /DNA_START=575 /DNA_END=877 /DNA_ORIENTATION=+
MTYDATGNTDNMPKTITAPSKSDSTDGRTKDCVDKSNRATFDNANGYPLLDMEDEELVVANDQGDRPEKELAPREYCAKLQDNHKDVPQGEHMESTPDDPT